LKRVTISEHEPVGVGPGELLSEAEAAALRRFDSSHAKRVGHSILDWSRASGPKARGWVGVLQVPGLQLEIVPKTEKTTADPLARKNLLHMLRTAGLIAARDRSLASLDHQRVPLLDAFAVAFADSLELEMRRGVDHGYTETEDDLPVIRGRLLVHEQVRRNAFRQHRVRVRFDEFSADTRLNRILKAACSLLARRASSAEAMRRLRAALAYLDDASDLAGDDLGLAALSRQSERFQPHLDFARMVLEGHSPTPRTGDRETFSLLFPMHRVFEGFVAGLVRSHSDELGLGSSIHVAAQAGGHFLARTPEGARQFELIPDLRGRDAQGKTTFVLDTKWKLLQPAKGGSVSPGDAHQLFAYGRRFESPLNVLLYPAVPGLQEQTLAFEAGGGFLRVAFLDVNRDLVVEQPALLRELTKILRTAETLAA
jgi:5-methylcytosine-specific restriction enzyme subunit McrC